METSSAVWSAQEAAARQHRALMLLADAAYLLLHLDADADILGRWHCASLGPTDALHGLARGATATAEQQEQTSERPATSNPRSSVHGAAED
jgi:hypothetical protein